MRPIRILVFARDPVAGRVKTRLIPALGAEGALRLYLLLLDHVLAQVAGAAPGAVELWCDRRPRSDLLAARAGDVPLRVQQGSDLGARMHHALTTVLDEGALPILVGSDLPGLTTAHCLDAAAALRDGADAVFAPALDGGYGLVGLTSAWPAAFVDMPWGSAEVMARTRRRAALDARALREVDPLWDLDEPGDLARLDALPAFAGWRAAARAS